MKATRAAMGRLPETVRWPIHTWRFGNELTWVFLGGEVVSEYQLAIEKQLGGEVWVAAYVDDVSLTRRKVNACEPKVDTKSMIR